MGFTDRLNTLFTMLDGTESISEIADINYELFKLSKKDEHQKPALDFYLKLKAKSPDRPNYELDKRLKVLKKIEVFSLIDLSVIRVTSTYGI